MKKRQGGQWPFRPAKRGMSRFMSYLKFHRMALGLKQTEVARMAGISQSAYCEYERGIKRPRPREHKRLAEALGRPISEFTAKLYGARLEEMYSAE